ncbi:MAG: ribonuclease III domain-containing protein [Promethearchaeota archaeon]
MVAFREIFEAHYPAAWEDFNKVCRKIQRILGHEFNNPEILWHALSIRGSRLPSADFERLEFLGDSLIKAAHGILLYEKSGDFLPGELTVFRANLENNAYFGSLADELHLNELGKILEIGVLSDSQAADCFEAIIAAVFLDRQKDFDFMIDLIKRLTHFQKRLAEIKNSPWGLKDPKSYLNEWVQKQYGNEAELVFATINEGSMNAPQYKSKAIIRKKSDNKTLFEGGFCNKGFLKKRKSEKEAAKILVLKLRNEGYI